MPLARLISLAISGRSSKFHIASTISLGLDLRDFPSALAKNLSTRKSDETGFLSFQGHAQR